jgi:hypothetical protein
MFSSYERETLKFFILINLNFGPLVVYAVFLVYSVGQKVLLYICGGVPSMA